MSAKLRTIDYRSYIKTKLLCNSLKLTYIKFGALKTAGCMVNMFIFLHITLESRIFFISASWSVKMWKKWKALYGQ